MYVCMYVAAALNSFNDLLRERKLVFRNTNAELSRRHIYIPLHTFASLKP